MTTDLLVLHERYTRALAAEPRLQVIELLVTELSRRRCSSRMTASPATPPGS
jgi:hypothetical protein